MKPHALHKMTHRIQLFCPKVWDDQGGGHAEAWQDLGSCWAAFSPSSTKILHIGHGLERLITHKVTIRFDGRIQPGFFIKYGKRSFTIEWAVDPDESKTFLVLLCLEHPTGDDYV